ncbi:MAG: CHAT domain-containing protein [Saprospiraceae bacterium]
MKINKSTIEEKVIAGKMEEAIEMLLKLGKHFDKELHNMAIMLSSRFSNLRNDKKIGIIAAADADLYKNRLNFSLIQTLGDIKETWEIEEKEEAVSESSPQRTILFLAANPHTEGRLRLDVEAREIEEGLKRSKERDSFKFVQKWAVRVPDLSRALMDENPNIIHFSGHGSEYGRIILEDAVGNGKEVPPKAIGNLFSLFKDKIECVVLNACYSEAQAQEISKHIPFVIGMNTKIPDQAALAFSAAFYDALGSGKNIDFAFKLGQISIEMFNLEGANIPILIKK